MEPEPDTETPMGRFLDLAIAFFDTSDRNNDGWAYRLTYSDGHEESGPMDATDGDEALTELWDLVADNAGSDDGSVAYYGGGEGAYIWTAPDRLADMSPSDAWDAA